jgi:hypothetical protein
MRQPSSATWRTLAPGVHVVSIDEDLVLLDVGRDRYACLPGAASVAVPDGERARLRLPEGDFAEDLGRAGYITDAAVDRPAWQPPPAPRASVLTTRVEPVRWSDAPVCARAMADLWLAYRDRSLSDLIATARSKSVPPSVSASDEALALVADFHRWSPFAPTSAKCLLRAFMLLRLLQRRGHDALWVFGVRTRPFEAHCWLQIGDIVLDEHLDRIAAHQPILVV